MKMAVQLKLLLMATTIRTFVSVLRFALKEMCAVIALGVIALSAVTDETNAKI